MSSKQTLFRSRAKRDLLPLSRTLCLCLLLFSGAAFQNCEGILEAFPRDISSCLPIS